MEPDDGILRKDIAADDPVAELPEAARAHASGGTLRALLGLGLGALVGFAVALVVPRDQGPRRPAPQPPQDRSRWR